MNKNGNTALGCIRGEVHLGCIGMMIANGKPCEATSVSTFMSHLPPPKTNMTGWNIHHLKMYFLLGNGGFSS